MRLPALLDAKADPRAGAGPKLEPERRDHAGKGFDKIFATLDGAAIPAETPFAALGKTMKPPVAARAAAGEPGREVPNAIERSSVDPAGSFAIVGLPGVVPADRASGTPGEAGQGVIKQGAVKRGAGDDAFALGDLAQGLVGVQGPAGAARPDASREAADTLVPAPGSAIRPESPSAAAMVSVTDIVLSSTIAPAGKDAFACALASREMPSASLVAGGKPAATEPSAGAAPKNGDPDEERSGSSSGPAPVPREPTAASPEKSEAFATIAGASAPAPEAGQLAALPSALRAIVDGTIVDGAVALAGAPAATAVPDAAHAPAPARTMALRLSYGEHGSIDVRLHLVGQALDVRLTVADKHAQGVIGRDRDALAGALREQHFELRSLVIQGSDALPPGENNANNPASDGSAGHPSGGGASGPPGEGGERQAKASSDRLAEPFAAGIRDDPGPGGGARSDTLFV